MEESASLASACGSHHSVGRGLCSGICLNTRPIKQTISELLAVSQCWLTQRRAITLLKTRQGRLSHWSEPGVSRHRERRLIEARDHSDSPESPELRPPLTAAQCWTHAGTQEAWGVDGGGRLVRRWVSVLESVGETLRHSFTRCSRGAADVNSTRLGFMRWRFNRNRDAARFGALSETICRDMNLLDDLCAALSSNGTNSAVVHLNWIHWQ